MPFHLSPDGNPGRCSAKPGNCPYADESEHYSTVAGAREAYEADQPSLFGTSEKPVAHPEADRRGGAATVQELQGEYDQDDEVEFLKGEIELIEAQVREQGESSRLTGLLASLRAQLRDVEASA